MCQAQSAKAKMAKMCKNGSVMEWSKYQDGHLMKSMMK